jgi:uncharacterized protein (DUF736 family)
MKMYYGIFKDKEGNRKSFDKMTSANPNTNENLIEANKYSVEVFDSKTKAGEHCYKLHLINLENGNVETFYCIKNKFKEKGSKAPDYKNIHKDVNIACWVKETKKGIPYLSVQVERVPDPPVENVEVEDDDIPF